MSDPYIDPVAKYRNDPRSTETLLARSRELDPDQDDEDYWQCMGALQHRLRVIFEQLRDLSHNPDDTTRSIVATVLGQRCLAEKVHVNECVETILKVLSTETSSSVLVSIGFALGHFRDPRATGPLISLSRNDDVDVRYAAVSSLCGCEEPKAIATLIERSGDENYDVRNWATFGLGSMIETDTKPIRAALLARLEEEEAEIRGEALVGLARRGDPRVIDPLMRELNRHDPLDLRGWSLINDVAYEVIKRALSDGSKVWLPVLRRLVELELGDPADLSEALGRLDASRGE